MTGSVGGRHEHHWARHVHVLDLCARAVAGGDPDGERAASEVVRHLASEYEGSCVLLLQVNDAGQLVRSALASSDASQSVRLSAAIDATISKREASTPLVSASEALLLPRLGDDARARLQQAAPLLAEVASACDGKAMIAVPLAAARAPAALVLLLLHEGSLDEDDLVLVESVASHAALALAIARERRARRPSLPDPSYLQMSVDALPAMIAYWDAEQVCRFANKAYRVWFGRDPKDVIGAHMQTFLGPLYALNRPYIEAALRGETQQFERLIPDPKGGPGRCSQALYVPDIGPEGVRGFAVLVVDITERKKVELELARAKDAADHANRDLETFSYSVAHDLRAPLRAIGGFGQLLAMSRAVTDDAEAAEWLNDIRESAEVMEKLIDGLLRLAGVTRREIHRERVDLAALARQAALRLGVGSDRPVELVVPAELLAHADPALAAVLIDNLLGNAWKFTSKKENARIELGVTTQAGVETFFVRDNGVGFDAAHGAQLFTPFRRFHAASEYPGSGIGLATVERIVRRHGGSVSATGSVGEGATIYFSLSPPPPMA